MAFWAYNADGKKTQQAFCFEGFGVELAQEVELGRMVPLLIEVQTEEFCLES